MRNALFKFGMWLVRKFGPPSQIMVPYEPRLLEAARDVVAEVSREYANASAENKHARAFAKLRRAVPDATTRDVGLAIELALR